MHLIAQQLSELRSVGTYQLQFHQAPNSQQGLISVTSSNGTPAATVTFRPTAPEATPTIALRDTSTDVKRLILRALNHISTTAPVIAWNPYWQAAAQAESWAGIMQRGRRFITPQGPVPLTPFELPLPETERRRLDAITTLLSQGVPPNVRRQLTQFEIERGLINRVLLQLHHPPELYERHLFWLPVTPTHQQLHLPGSVNPNNPYGAPTLLPRAVSRNVIELLPEPAFAPLREYFTRHEARCQLFKNFPHLYPAEQFEALVAADERPSI